MWNKSFDTAQSYGNFGGDILMTLLVTKILLIHIPRRRAKAATSHTQLQCGLSARYAAGRISDDRYLGLDV